MRWLWGEGADVAKGKCHRIVKIYAACVGYVCVIAAHECVCGLVQGHA